MPEKLILSTAYLPPVEHFSLIKNSHHFVIEACENYVKQTYRNRCYILSQSGPHILVVPVLEGSRKKVGIREVRIDYSKRWQQVHLRAIRAAYGSSPWFDFYFDEIEHIILACHEYLFDLNCTLLKALLKILKINSEIKLTDEFEPCSDLPYDFRYNLHPGNRKGFQNKRYQQVFGDNDFIPNMSITDLVFNMGPESGEYL